MTNPLDWLARILSKGSVAPVVDATPRIDIPKAAWYFAMDDRSQSCAILNLTSLINIDECPDYETYQKRANETFDRVVSEVKAKTSGEIKGLEWYGCSIRRNPESAFNEGAEVKFGRDLATALRESGDYFTYPDVPGGERVTLVYAKGDEQIRTLVQALGITSLAKHGYAPHNRAGVPSAA